MDQQLHHYQSMPTLGSQMWSTTAFVQDNGRIFPPEIMTIVFELVLTHHGSGYGKCKISDERRQEDAATIRRASQVCRYWREVALTCPRIWAQIMIVDFITLEWTQELIHRSKKAPLIVESDGAWDPDCDRFKTPRWQAIFAEIKRIKVLHASLLHTDDMSPLIDVVLQPAPLLESCSIVFEPEDAEDGPVADIPEFMVELFDGNAPKLRCLTIDEVVLPSLRLADFSGLRLLHLDIVFREMSMPLSLSRWLDILAGQPLLEFLTLSHFLVDRFDGSSSDQELRKVNLPHLNTLYFAADIVDGGALFGHLLLPPTAYIHLNLEQHTYDSSIECLSSGLQTVFRNWDEHYGSGCFQWRLETGKHDSFNMGIGPGDLESNFFLPQLSIEYNVDQDIRHSPFRHPFRDFLRLFRNAPLIKREAILYMGLRLSHQVIWEQQLLVFLSAFEKVSKLILCGRRLDRRLISVLESPPHPPPVPEDLALLFPHLSYVAFDGQKAKPDSIQMFHDFLGWRFLLGRRVPTIMLLDDKDVPSPEIPGYYFEKTLQMSPTIKIASPAPPYCSLCGTS